MDPRQIYRLADTLNPLGYPQRVTILNICLRDNQYHRSRIEAELDMMYQRRWLIERSKIRIFQDWESLLEQAYAELKRIKECHLTIMEPERCWDRGLHVSTWSEARIAGFLLTFGIRF